MKGKVFSVSRGRRKEFYGGILYSLSVFFAACHCTDTAEAPEELHSFHLWALSAGEQRCLMWGEAHKTPQGFLHHSPSGGPEGRSPYLLHGLQTLVLEGYGRFPERSATDLPPQIPGAITSESPPCQSEGVHADLHPLAPWGC